MSSQNDNPVQGHEYDGIQELDNPLPRWWVLTFVATVVFSFFYVLHYHTQTNLLISDEYAEDLSRHQSTNNKPESPISEEQVTAYASDTVRLEKGRATFMSKCAACHLVNGGGSIGPNLTDKYWIIGQGTGAQIASVVEKGVLEKGMPAWGALISPEEVLEVSAFVTTLKNTNVQGGKAPQGNEVQ